MEPNGRQVMSLPEQGRLTQETVDCARHQSKKQRETSSGLDTLASAPLSTSSESAVQRYGSNGSQQFASLNVDGSCNPIFLSSVENSNVTFIQHVTVRRESPGQKQPESSTDTTYGIHPMFKKAAENPKSSIAEPRVSLIDRVSTAEATVLAFAAEKSLPYAVVPDLVALSKSLAKDKQALDGISMDRTSASYKMTYGLGKTFQEECVEDLQTSFFSLNIDECTSESNLRVVSVLVCYYSDKDQTVVIKHLSSFAVTKVDSKTLYQELVKLFEELRLPWKNLVSILMDSCNVMRGSKGGLETLIRKNKAPHMLDVDGDSCHHAHNAAKYFCAPFEKYVEGLLTSLFNDFKWSAYKKEVLTLVCDTLGIKGTSPENYVSHRWLSVYDVSVDTVRMWDAYIVFYFAFLSDDDRVTYHSCVLDIYKKHNVGKKNQQAIKELQNQMRPKMKTMTKEGVERTNRIVQKLFFTAPKTKVLLHVFISVLPLLKKYVMLFQMETSLVHLLNDKQTELLKNFLCCFIRPEKLREITPRGLVQLQVDDKTNRLPDNAIFLVKHIQSNLPKTMAQEVTRTLVNAYVKCAECLQRKMPVNNQLLRSISAIDPICRGHTTTLRYLLRLPQLVSNVFTDDCSKEQFDIEARQYQLGSTPKSTEGNMDIVSFWSGCASTYPNLTKMVFSLLSCFHGPAVESSFSIMKDVLNKKKSSLQVGSFSAIQTVKYELMSNNKTALQYFDRADPSYTPVNTTLCKNMRAAYRTYADHKDSARKKEEEKKNKMGFEKPVKTVTVSSKTQTKLEQFKRAQEDLEEHRVKKQKRAL